MTKEQEEAKDLTNKLHQMKRDKNKFVQKWREFVYFAKFLTEFAFAVLIIACGAYTTYKGIKSTYTLAHVGLIVAGVAAALEGFVLLWKSVVNKK